MSAYADLIPVNVLTGALGSGKTTLLKALLRAPRLAGTMVLVNELGEVGIDHHLVEHASESTLLLENGCLCCAMRDDLKSALKELHARRDQGEIPHYERVVVETTGIADPVPIAYTLLAEPVLQHHYRLGNVVTVVDAINAPVQLDRFPEPVRQVALADRLVVSKLDIAGPGALQALSQRLAALNPDAPLLAADSPDLDPVDLLITDIHDRQSKSREVARWMHAAGDAAGANAGRDPHPAAITATCFTFDAVLDWTAFGVWMSMLLHRHGDRVLRLKGLLNVAGVPGPVLVNGVQHLVHPPAHLDRWPDDDRASRLVVISNGLDREEIERSLQVFNALANPRPARNLRQARTAGERATWASTRTGCGPAPDAGSIRYG
ncbi:MAG: GTP-binding protein [Gammaproteobacteria bacterium]|nr:GTP-binding protein [Gammaproteobacteria bacterium]MDE0368019.1 GTP-binding protein [Gammaproteobacteria bacterium]